MKLQFKGLNEIDNLKLILAFIKVTGEDLTDAEVGLTLFEIVDRIVPSEDTLRTVKNITLLAFGSDLHYIGGFELIDVDAIEDEEFYDDPEQKIYDYRGFYFKMY